MRWAPRGGGTGCPVPRAPLPSHLQEPQPGSSANSHSSHYQLNNLRLSLGPSQKPTVTGHLESNPPTPVEDIHLRNSLGGRHR